jgi:uncharacterized protein YprB with RNaseH-like and TPR domain
MSSLSDRFKALGVRLGAENITRKEPKRRFPIEQVIEGKIMQTGVGEAYIIDQVCSYDSLHGNQPIQFVPPPPVMVDWARDGRIANTSQNQFVFLDTETTGLGGSSGTYAFLVGAGRFEKEGFRLVQFFMREPAEEAAILTALDAFMIPEDEEQVEGGASGVLVTFNGKAFDGPLLDARYILQGTKSPLRDFAQLDLLHLARRIWRNRLQSRTLMNLEQEILKFTRSQEDVPGWMIPQMYFDYLRSGDARPLTRVIYHNAMDILSMVALMSVLADILLRPLEGTCQYALDQLAVGKLYADMGYLDNAALIIEQALDSGLPLEYNSWALERLGQLHRRRGDWDAAISVWIQAASEREVNAHIELAKYYEHRIRDIEEALRWTQAALALIDMPEYPNFQRELFDPELRHRLARLERKLGN